MASSNKSFKKMKKKMGGLDSTSLPPYSRSSSGLVKHPKPRAWDARKIAQNHGNGSLDWTYPTSLSSTSPKHSEPPKGLESRRLKRLLKFDCSKPR